MTPGRVPMVALEAFVPAHVRVQNTGSSCNVLVSGDGSRNSFIEGGVTIIVHEGLLEPGKPKNHSKLS